MLTFRSWPMHIVCDACARDMTRSTSGQAGLSVPPARPSRSSTKALLRDDVGVGHPGCRSGREGRGGREKSQASQGRSVTCRARLARSTTPGAPHAARPPFPHARTPPPAALPLASTIAEWRSGRGRCIGGFCHCNEGYWGLGCVRSKAYASEGGEPHCRAPRQAGRQRAVGAWLPNRCLPRAHQPPPSCALIIIDTTATGGRPPRAAAQLPVVRLAGPASRPAPRPRKHTTCCLPHRLSAHRARHCCCCGGGGVAGWLPDHVSLKIYVYDLPEYIVYEKPYFDYP